MKKFTLVAALVLSFAGCKTQIDSAKAEEAIKAGIKTQTGQDVKSLSCPSGVAAKAGGTFDCKGKSGDGKDFVVTVTINDEAGNVAWKLTSVDGKSAPDGTAPAPAAAAPAAPAAEHPAEPAEPAGSDEHKE